MAALDDALQRAMAEHQLDSEWRGTVLELIERRDQFWRRCCESNCDPCALQLARVVDRVRQLMQAQARVNETSKPARD